MRKAAIVVGAGLILCMCLGSATVAVFLLAQLPGYAPPPLRSFLLQHQAQNQACMPPAQIAPGTYQSVPAQFVGEWTVITY